MRLKPLILTALLTLPLTGFSQNQPAQSLQSVQKAIEAAQNELRKNQQAQKKADQTINRTQAELNRLQRELNDINRRQSRSVQQLEQLHRDLARLQTETSNTKAQIARLLSANYKNRQNNAIVLLLNNADSGQKSRFLQYSRYINEANDKVLQQLAEQQNQLNQQETRIQNELKRLQQLSNEREKRIIALRKNAQAAQAESRKIERQITTQTQKINRLRQDEQRLNRLIRDLATQQASRQKTQSNKAPTTSTPQNNKANTTPKATPKQNNTSTLTQEDLKLQAADHFSRQQGKLNRPSSGKLTGRFGQNRESGGVWRGLFYQTPPAAVRSIAEGQASYAGFLSGYGNTIIINHGDGYVSVYTGLSSISIAVNSPIAAGQNIGTSGTLPTGEQGLYFELRYRSSAINPSSWLR